MVGDIFEACHDHLGKVLKMCIEINLVLNWEKCNFMVKEGIVLGHKIWVKVFKWTKLRWKLLQNYILLFQLRV